MKIRVNKHKLNIHCRGSPWGSRTQQHAYCLRYAHPHHIESHLGKKQPQAKITIAFLFGQLHFNNVTSHALFYGGHLVMRSKRCAVQNQGITLSLPGSTLVNTSIWRSSLSLCQQCDYIEITAFENSSITTQTYNNLSLCIYVNGSQLRRVHHAFGTPGFDN